MKRILIALLVVFCFSCSTVAPTPEVVVLHVVKIQGWGEIPETDFVFEEMGPLSNDVKMHLVVPAEIAENESIAVNVEYSGDFEPILCTLNKVDFDSVDIGLQAESGERVTYVLVYFLIGELEKVPNCRLVIPGVEWPEGGST